MRARSAEQTRNTRSSSAAAGLWLQDPVAPPRLDQGTRQFELRVTRAMDGPRAPPPCAPVTPPRRPAPAPRRFDVPLTSGTTVWDRWPFRGCCARSTCPRRHRPGCTPRATSRSAGSRRWSSRRRRAVLWCARARGRTVLSSGCVPSRVGDVNQPEGAAGLGFGRGSADPPPAPRRFAQAACTRRRPLCTRRARPVRCTT